MQPEPVAFRGPRMPTPPPPQLLIALASQEWISRLEVPGLAAAPVLRQMAGLAAAAAAPVLGWPGVVSC